MKLEVLVNHVGYERRGPKRFLVASNEELDPFETSFEVRDGTSRTLWEGDLRGAGGRSLGPATLDGRRRRWHQTDRGGQRQRVDRMRSPGAYDRAREKAPR